MSHLEKKRRKGNRIFRFKRFCENGYPVEFFGTFRENVATLLELASFERSLCSGMQIWSFQLEVYRHPPIHVVLFVVEEPIEASSDHHCKLCKYVGWGENMVCNKKYHFILPSKKNEIEGVKLNIVELQGHLLHGVFHSNGFGHLLSLNGLETGSDLTGQLLISFWDRLCTGLRARKVSLYDISKKQGMDLRLLYTLSYGSTWFEKWGYKWARGTYGVTHSMYQKAIEAIQSMPLHFLSNSNQDIAIIFTRYQTLSDYSLLTLGDLFHFLFDLKPTLPKENSIATYNNSSLLIDSTCRWSAKRVDMATHVIVQALKNSGPRWVSRQEVRDVARAYIGDTGLLDFVLKSLGNHIVGKYLVRRSLNPVTKVLEYCLEDVSNIFPNQVLSDSKSRGKCKITEIQLMKDMKFLYNYIFKECQNQGLTMASMIILDSKYFVKEYSEDSHCSKVEGKLNLFCTIFVKNVENPNVGLPPYENVRLKSNATFDELKQEVERVFREIYWGMRGGIVIGSMVDMNVRGSDLVFGQVEVGRKMVFEGSVREVSGKDEYMYEKGLMKNNVVVECVCGIEEDDGERLISCDICEVWQHTRCVGVPNEEEIPRIFLCNRCEHEIMQLSSLPY